MLLLYAHMLVQSDGLELEGEPLPSWQGAPALLQGGVFAPLASELQHMRLEGEKLAAQLEQSLDARVLVELGPEATWEQLEVPLRSAGAAGFERFELEHQGQRVGPVELPGAPRPFIDARPVRVKGLQTLALYDGERIAPSFRVLAPGEDRLGLGRARRDYHVDCQVHYGEDAELLEICQAGEPRPVCVASFDELPGLFGVVVLLDEELPVVEQLELVERARGTERPVALDGGAFDCPEELADARELQRSQAAFLGSLATR